MDEATAKKNIQELILDFKANFQQYKGEQEANTETKLIEPLFSILGWTKADFEKRARTRRENKRGFADYAFKIDGRNAFFLEVKKLGVPLEKEADRQVISYASSQRIPFAVSTNFEQLKIFCVEQENAINQTFRVFTKPEEYITNYQDLVLLSRENFEKNLTLKKAEDEGRLRRRTSIDKALLEDFMSIRKLMADDLEKTYPNKYELNEKEEIVQRVIDRLIFIRRCEDVGINPDNLYLEEIKHFEDSKAYSKLKDIFAKYDTDYNSGLFAIKADNDLDVIKIDGSIIKKLVSYLYESKDKQYVYNFDWITADILGEVYEQYLGKILEQTKSGKAKLKDGQAHRKEQGIYYTPTYIVENIVKNTVPEVLKNKKIKINEIKILDPACGSGSFLIKTFDYLYGEFKKNEKSNQRKFDIQGTYSIKTEILKKNVYGVDLDNKAVEITKLNLLLKASEKARKLPEEIDLHIKNGNSLIEDENITKQAFKWEGDFEKGTFDVVIGNPPYFNIKANDDLKSTSDFKLLSDGVVNAASLFLKRGFDLLKSNGYLGFIIPKSFLVVDSWYPIRKKLLDNSQFVSITDVSMAFDEVGLEQVVIIIRKVKPSSNLVKIFNGTSEINSIPQEFFRKKGVILTSLDKEKYKIVERIEDKSINFGDIADMPRGITVNSLEYSPTANNNLIQVLGGTNVEKYNIKEGNKRKPNRYLARSDKRIQQKTPIFKSGRIIYQNVVSSVPKIVATLEHKGLPTDDTINNVVLNDKNISPKWILAILNSNLMTFYLKYAIINCSILTVHLDKSYIGKIPIKKISSAEQNNVGEIVDRIISLMSKLDTFGEKKTSETARLEGDINNNLNKINQLVYKVYGITDEEKKCIEDNGR